MNAPGLRLGVFGGAFDPPHLAHRALVEAFRDQFALDAVRVFPTGQAWHRSRRTSRADHRLAMARLAFTGCERVFVDDRECRRAGPTYTVDTLEALRAEYPQAALFLLIGEDQARAFGTWHRWRDIAALATLVVATRPGHEVRPAGPGQAPDPLAAMARAERLELPPMDVSATVIRARVAGGEGIDHLVDPAVARYIDQHLLYRPA